MNNLQGIFGMFEMELAAARILEKENSPIWIDDFVNKREITGFLCLIGYGWLKPGYPNGCFTVTPEFIDRCRDQKTGDSK